MGLEDLLVRHIYRVKKIDGKMVATLDEDGNYRATCKEDVERALTDGSNVDAVFVTSSREWHEIKRKN